MTLVGVSVACQNGRHETCRGHEERNVYHPCCCACHAEQSDGTPHPLSQWVKTLRQNGTPEGIAAAIGRARDAQLDTLRAAGEPIPPTIREMDAAADSDDSDVLSNLTEQEREQMIAENVASIKAVPQSVWEANFADGSGLARRQWALHWARLGYDVYAGCDADAGGVWVLWLDGERIELGRAAEGGVI